VRALMDAEQYIKENPTSAIAAVSDVTGMEREVLEKIWSDFDFGVVLDDVLLQFMAREAKWAIETERTDSKDMPDFSRMIYVDALKQVKPERVKMEVRQ
jgi:ABC-type nitrate/sulfonate/bicarbonate transport system substrate-binding protein